MSTRSTVCHRGGGGNMSPPLPPSFCHLLVPFPAGLTTEELMGKRKPRLKWLRHASHSTDTHGKETTKTRVHPRKSGYAPSLGLTRPPLSHCGGVLILFPPPPPPHFTASLPGSETTSVNTETAGEEEAQPNACDRCL